MNKFEIKEASFDNGKTWVKPQRIDEHFDKLDSKTKGGVPDLSWIWRKFKGL